MLQLGRFWSSRSRWCSATYRGGGMIGGEMTAPRGPSKLSLASNQQGMLEHQLTSSSRNVYRCSVLHSELGATSQISQRRATQQPIFELGAEFVRLEMTCLQRPSYALEAHWSCGHSVVRNTKLKTPDLGCPAESLCTCAPSDRPCELGGLQGKLQM